MFPPCYLKVKVKVRSLSHVRLFATQTPWTVAHQAPLSMGFSRQEYWSGLPFPSPRDHPDLGIEFKSPTLQADALTSEPPGKPPVIYLGPNYGGGNEVLQMGPCRPCYSRCPQPCSRPPPTHASAGDSWTLTGKSGSVFCGATAPFSWVLVCTRFCLCPPRVYFPSSV